MTELQKQIQTAVRKIYKSGKTGDSLLRLIRNEVKRLVRLYGSAADLNNAQGFASDLLKQIDYESFALFKLASKKAESVLNNSVGVLLGFSQRIDRLDRIAIKAITSTIYDATVGGKSWREAARAAVEKAGVLAQHSGTEVETAMGGLDRVNVIDKALQGGITKFRLSGPSGTQRPWCAKHLDEVHTIEEWKSMSNGQGLPVVPYCGGYNCRHRLVPVPD